MQIYPPPATAHQDCSACKAHRLTEKDQHELELNGVDLTIVDMDDFTAQRFLSDLMSEEKRDRQHVRDMVESHGDLIETRWKKFTRGKRADLLSSASPDLFPPGARESLEELGPWERDGIGHFDFSWLEPDAFSEDRMKLMYLIHVRSEFDAARWAVFDTQSNWRAFSISPYVYNPGAVVMHGEYYGELVEFKAEEAHSWLQVGFPRAALTFRIQRKLAGALRAIVEAIVGDAGPSGHEKWTTLMLRGPQGQGGHEEARYGQEFTPPAKIEPLGLLKKVHNQLDEHIDEIELMQTDPEYMRQCALEIKENTSFPNQRGKVEGDEWTKTAHAIHWGCLQPLTCWGAIVKEGEYVEATLLAELGPNIAPGDQLTRKADTAMRSFTTWYTKHASSPCCQQDCRCSGLLA
jgi:hypothetical protein